VSLILGLIGLINNTSNLLRGYAVSHLVSLGLSFNQFCATLYYSSELSKEAADLTDTEEANMRIIFIEMTILWEILADLLSLVFAHIINKLAVSIDKNKSGTA
jgi:hypothetical protein